MHDEDAWLEHRLTRDDLVGALLAAAICLGLGALVATFGENRSGEVVPSHSAELSVPPSTVPGWQEAMPDRTKNLAIDGWLAVRRVANGGTYIAPIP